MMKTMTKYDRYALICVLLNDLRAAKSWCGETHVQKAIYLAQEVMGVPYGFDFILYKHGPYSFDLSSELTSMRADNVIQLQAQSYPYGPTLIASAIAEKLIQDRVDTWRPYKKQLEFIADSIGNKGVSELERLATAFYISLHGDIGPDVQARTAALNSTKPHISIDLAKSAILEADQMSQRARKKKIA